MKGGIIPKLDADLSRLRVVTTGGSPMWEGMYEWMYESIGSDLMVASISGGTDVCTAFVGGCPILPVYANEITCRCLGVKVEAFDENGKSVQGREGELVVTEPMPSMPLGLWGDIDDQKYLATYFNKYEGVWHHGDWLTVTERGTAVISGRSDATLNRGGVRMGTQEFYSALDGLEQVADALVVHLEDPTGGQGELLLFVVINGDGVLSDATAEEIRTRLRTRLSPRHVPTTIVAVPHIPRTGTGKRLEVPIKRLLTGARDADSVGALATDPSALAPFIRLAEERAVAAPRSTILEHAGSPRGEGAPQNSRGETQ